MSTRAVPRYADFSPKAITFPRPVGELQIEITSRCNLRCAYCPSPALMRGVEGRPAVDMDETTYLAALVHVRAYVEQGTQKELHLTGLGENTLHPEFVRYVALAREAAGETVPVIFATNGVIASDELARALAPYRPEIYVSLHRPEKAARAVEIYRKYNLLAGATIDPVINANDWAGQLKWFTTPNTAVACTWLREGRAYVLADGRVSTCCLDAYANGVVGHVLDLPGSLHVKPYKLCATCNQQINVAGYEQYPPQEATP